MCLGWCVDRVKSKREVSTEKEREKAILYLQGSSASSFTSYSSGSTGSLDDDEEEARSHSDLYSENDWSSKGGLVRVSDASYSESSDGYSVSSSQDADIVGENSKKKKKKRRRKKKKKEKDLPPPSLDHIATLETDKYDWLSKIGEGAVGTVCKVMRLSDNMCM